MASGKTPIDQFFDAVNSPGSGLIASGKVPKPPASALKRRPKPPPVSKVKAPKQRPPRQRRQQPARQAPKPPSAKLPYVDRSPKAGKLQPRGRPLTAAEKRQIDEPRQRIRQQVIHSAGFVPAAFDPFPSSQQVSHAVNDVINIPAGLYQTGKAGVQDIGAAAHGDFSFTHTRKIARGMYEGAKFSLQHPEVDPFGTALTIAAAAAPVARLADIGEAAAIGGARAAARTAVNRGPQAVASRSLKLGDFKTEAMYSRSSSARLVQRAHDKLVQEAARQRPQGAAANYLARRIGREERKNRLVSEAIQRAPAAVLARHHLTAPQQAALRAYAENTPAPARVAFHEARAETMAGAAKARHTVHAGLNRLAAKYLTTDGHGNVQFADTKAGRRLAAVYKEMEQAAHDRDRLRAEVGFTPSETRVNAPARLIGEEAPGRIRVPYESRRAPKAQAQSARIGASGMVQYAGKTPGSYTHEFTGGLLRSGKFRTATTKVLAESHQEAQRYTALTAGLARVKAAVHYGPPGPHDIPVRLTPKLSPAARDLLHKADEGIQLSRKERTALAADFQDFHGEAFPTHLAPDEIRPGEVGYINKHLLGGLDRSPVVTPSRSLKVWDAANSIAKAALIYAKPGYIPANLVGNLLLNVSQQGAEILLNLPRAAALSRRIGADAAKVDNLMGAGLTRGIVGDETQMLEHAVGKLADIVSTPTDRYTRRASFLYEARRAGFGSPAGIRRLLNDPKLQPQLMQVARRAREAAIEYENLTPFEKGMVRRIVFIYPWVKGSTTYAGRFVREHPVQSAAVYQLGDQGRQAQDQQLGARPSYLQGIFKVGGTDANPLTVNPAAAANFGTPAQLVDMARGIVTGQMNKQDWPLQMLTPGLQLAAGAAMGVNPQTGAPIKTPTDVFPEFATSLPQVRLAQALAGKKPTPQQVYQRTKGEEIGKYLAGSIFPATTSKVNLNKVALAEAKTNWSPEKRAQYTAHQDYLKFVAALKKYRVAEALPDGKLHPTLERVWALRQRRLAAVASIHRPPPGATDAQRAAYQRQALIAEIGLALKLRLWKPDYGSAATLRRQAQQSSDVTKLEHARRVLHDYVYGERVIGQVKAAAARKYGAEFG